MRFKSMFQPIEIGPITVPNRFVVPPMGNNFANTDGTLSEKSKTYYEARAKGGFGLITIESSVVYNKSKGGPRKPCLFSDDSIDSFKMVIDACHAHGAKVSVQLQHAGPEVNATIAGHNPIAASAIPTKASHPTPDAVSTEELYEIIEAYGDAAYRAKKSGIDAVELHCAHGYLVSSFISPRTNKRVDEFGGCFENRMRLPRLILENIRKKTEGTIAILCRINASDDKLGGVSIEDSTAIACYLTEVCGVDALHVSRATHLNDEYMWAPTTVHGGFSADLAAKIKAAVDVPVITVGRYTEPQFADIMVKQGKADLVAFGRQSIADPEVPNKSREGRLELMTPCIACLQGCVPNMFQGKPLTCLCNPLVGREDELKPAAESKKVLVVGGGVGGMEAAFVAAARGHKVTLVEKTNTLGGQMRLAAYPPGKGDLTNLVRNFIAKCELHGVEIKLNTEVSADRVKEISPDVVILATGAIPLVLPIPGINDTGIVHAVNLLDGKNQCGKKVLVVGGGLVGAETAAFLGEQEHDVTVIEMRDEVAADVASEHRKFLMKDFDEYKIKTITEAKVSEFVEGGVNYTLLDGSEHAAHEFDTVVLAMGARNYDQLSETVKEIVKDTFVIGDAVRARRALNATVEALEVALTI
ncbi:MAG: FAD-dependent oxidoreductase [Terrisporobacter sp.]|uniref:oxidoreductase n=1 Tax=Terrisporobacter sp. TaxID=1965305 RepID=UPI002FC994FB